ncbi:hypothetical protein OS493_003437 [Desmophyllum pertusum]|uniref:Uncharacterized protein n=1 Tax=Desmophyllum pertusum TaxID=174260 RepID=A0A9X0DCJ8_9CNID|nr:hypothetical protein OS493_003437 [Desmophyllum pertusum]
MEGLPVILFPISICGTSFHNTKNQDHDDQTMEEEAVTGAVVPLRSMVATLHGCPNLKPE